MFRGNEILLAFVPISVMTVKKGIRLHYEKKSFTIFEFLELEKAFDLYLSYYDYESQEDPNKIISFLKC